MDAVIRLTERASAAARAHPFAASLLVAGATAAAASSLLSAMRARHRRAGLATATVVITGASQGIGASLARQLATSCGATVILLARSKQALEAVARDINTSLGEHSAPRAFAYAVDCSNAAAVDAVAATITRNHGCPDIVVNNAGAGRWLALWETPAQEVAAALDAPLLAAAYVTRAFLPCMLAARRGTIVMVQSPASRTPFPGSTMYSVSRWGLRGLAASLRADLHGMPIRVQEVLLGETHSSYFVNNPGSAERVPTISGLVGRLTADDAAAAVIDCIVRGDEEHVAPLMLRITAGLHGWAPSLVQPLINATGWKYAPPS